MNLLWKPFFKIGVGLMERVPESVWKKEQGRLRALYPGEERSVKEVYGHRLGVVFAVLFWGLGAVIVLSLFLERGRGKVLFLTRPDYGGTTVETELEASVEGESEKVTLSVQVSPRTYRAEEIQAIFRNLTEELWAQILGENESLQEVRSDLELPDTLADGAVAAEWVVTPSDLMDEEGHILRQTKEDGELVELRALLKYQEQEAEFVCYANVCPETKTDLELLASHIQEAAEQADEEGKYETSLSLPQEVDEKKVSWSQVEDPVGWKMAALVVVLALGFWFYQEEQWKQKEKERKRQLILDYPDLLFQMAMLLRAGLTLKRTFQKMVSAYEKREKEEPRYVYEEMKQICHEMENGLGEAAAYEAFGKRCGESSYMKLGSLLSQNLKKGGKGLADLLEQEAAAGFQERKNTARKLGEEAGTKMLFPMMLMLAVVLVILVVPAAMSF